MDKLGEEAFWLTLVVVIGFFISLKIVLEHRTIDACIKQGKQIVVVDNKLKECK